MKELVLPVPETVSATYTVPVPSPVSTAEARRLAGEAVGARLTGPLRTLTSEWLAIRRGRPRPVNDMLVAACCLTHGVPLATLNLKDYEDFEQHHGLSILGAE